MTNRINQQSGASVSVAFSRCVGYVGQSLDEEVARVVGASGFTVRPGMQLLLKPNLVAAHGYHDLACSQPQFVAAVARYLLDCGARIKVGDSPATGRGLKAMQVCGLSEALAGLPVELVELRDTISCTLPNGRAVSLAREAVESDGLVNLPRVKAHCQLRLTLAIKNYFGLVKGWRKAMAHQRFGGGDASRFYEMLLVLPKFFPCQLNIIDGVVAMHKTGPMDGEPFALGLLGASVDATALDAALHVIVRAESVSPLLQLAREQGEPGAFLKNCHFPLLTPEACAISGFELPARLSPIRFSPVHVVASLAGRFKTWLAKR